MLFDTCLRIAEPVCACLIFSNLRCTAAIISANLIIQRFVSTSGILPVRKTRFLFLLVLSEKLDAAASCAAGYPIESVGRVRCNGMAYFPV
jgi:hypothetical protein